MEFNYTKYYIRNTRYRKLTAWLLALALVLPPYLVVFSPSVFAQLREVVVGLGETIGGEVEKYAFAGISPTSGTEIFFFNGSENVQITNNSVTDGNPQYDESSNKIVFQSLVGGIWQIFLYDLGTDTTVQLSYEGTNNLDPKISQGSVVWRSWVDGNWEIYFYDGAAAKRLTTNDSPDIEPAVSNGYVVWKKYNSGKAVGPDGSIRPEDYDIGLFDSLKNEFKSLASDSYIDDHVDIEFPYVVWQAYDGQDYEIKIFNITDGITAFLTSNDFDDTAPRIRGGKIKWHANIKKDKGRPQNIIKEDDQLRLEPVIIPESLPSDEIEPEELPFWWDDPLECPKKEAVCAYVKDEIVSYANECYVQKAKGQVLHPGVCTGEEVAPTPIPSPTEEILPVEASPSLSFSPTPELPASPSLGGPASGSLVEISSPTPVASSESVDGTLTPSPELVEPIILEPGTYENTASFEEDGSIIFEESAPFEEAPNPTESPLPTVNESVQPTVFEESALLEIGEAINEAVTDTASATANIINSLIGGGEDLSEQAVPESAPAEELIPVVE